MGFGQVEMGVMRLGTVVRRMGPFESSSGWDAVGKEAGKVWFGGDKIVAIGDVNPPKCFGRIGRWLRP